MFIKEYNVRSISDVEYYIKCNVFYISCFDDISFSKQIQFEILCCKDGYGIGT